MTAEGTVTIAADGIASLHSVTKRFGQRTVLDELTVSFAPNTRYVVRGPSGSGKSTLLNLLAGYVTPDAGRVRPAATTGYVLQDEMLFSAMSVRENLQVRAAAIGLDPDEAEPLMLHCLKQTNVAPLVDAIVAQLSGGERQRVQLAAQLLASVDLLLLDEPTSRLDADNRRGVAAVVSQAFYDRTVIVVTHDEDSPFLAGAVELHLENGKIVRV